MIPLLIAAEHLCSAALLTQKAGPAKLARLFALSSAGCTA